MSKKPLFIAVSVVLSLAVFLIMGEIIIRIEAFIKGGRIWTPDKYLHVQHIPNTEFTEVGYYKEYKAKGRINNWGFIGEDINLAKGKDTVRVIVLGDSFTEAVQVDWDKNYCSRLGALLDGKYEVINAGVSDYSPKLEYLYLREKLIYFEPDYLVLQLFSNDVHDDYRYKNEYKDNISLSYSNSFVYNHSKFYHYFLRQKAKLLKKIIKEKRRETIPADMRFFFIKQGNDKLKEEAWRNTEGYLLKIKELADKRGIKLAIFTIPIEAQVSSPQEMSEASQFYFEEKPTDDFDIYVERFCRGRGVDFIDMLPVFRDNKKLNLYFEKEGHLTEAGHRLVADVLYKYIENSL